MTQWQRRLKVRLSPRQPRRCPRWLWSATRGSCHTTLGDFNEDRIDKALGVVADASRSPSTVNSYRKCAYSLAEWAVKVARVLDRNPVAAIAKRQESADVRKVRRSLVVSEAYKLLSVCGPRRLFYSVQLWTGLRVAETAALEWRDLCLDGDRPCMKLRAEATKARRADELPLHPDLAGALIEAKPPLATPTDRVFKSTPTLRTFKGGWGNKRKDGKRYWHQGDLGRAGIPFKDDRGRTVDRHSLRTTHISWLGLHGVNPRAQIVLARHAPQGVTLKHYQDFTILDLWAEIRKLPPIRSKRPVDQAETAQATGTDDRQALSSEGVVLPVVQQPGITGANLAASGRMVTDGCHRQEARNPISKHGLRPAEPLPTAGFEPATSCSTGRRSNQLSYVGDLSAAYLTTRSRPTSRGTNQSSPRMAAVDSVGPAGWPGPAARSTCLIEIIDVFKTFENDVKPPF